MSEHLRSCRNWRDLSTTGISAHFAEVIPNSTSIPFLYQVLNFYEPSFLFLLVNFVPRLTPKDGDILSNVSRVCEVPKAFG